MVLVIKKKFKQIQLNSIEFQRMLNFSPVKIKKTVLKNLYTILFPTVYLETQKDIANIFAAWKSMKSYHYVVKFWQTSELNDFSSH